MIWITHRGNGARRTDTYATGRVPGDMLEGEQP